MKIASSQISLTSAHFKHSSVQNFEKLRFWIGSKPQNNETRPDSIEEIRKNINESVTKKLNESLKKIDDSIQKLNEKLNDSFRNFSEDPKMALIKYLFEKVFGIKLDLFSDEDLEEIRKISRFNIKLSEEYSKIDEKIQDNQNWGLEYEKKTIISESEFTNFSSSGKIISSDGKEFKFSFKLQMSRQFFEERNIEIQMGNAVRKDPLIINFNGTAAELSSGKFDFDIDSDGNPDKISMATKNSGFLALDKNKDGKINNGNELFGAKSGNGFSELSEYDEDKNGWIDENDKIFNELKIWTKDINGKDIYSSLSSKGIGAIYLKSASTPFDYKSDFETMNAQTKTTGVFLKENGTVGSIQQIDLFV